MTHYANRSHQFSTCFPISDGKILIGFALKSTISYLDDCNIFSRTAEERIERLREVFQRFKDPTLKINLLKCELFRQHMPLLGHIGSRDGIQADPAKTLAVRQYPVAKSVTGVNSLLGLTLFLLPKVGSRFRRNCSTISSANKKNERNPLEPRSLTGLCRTERLPHFVAFCSIPFVERANHSEY